MLPSRGLRPGILRSNRFPTPFAIRQNKFSTAPSQSSLLSRCRSSPLRSSIRPSYAATPAVASIYTSRLFSSSASRSSASNSEVAGQAKANAANTSTALPDTALPSFDELKDLDLDFTAHEGSMGYLAHLGLDFGWGPTSIGQWFIEFFHTGYNEMLWSTTPWWAAILATAAFYRVVLFPGYMRLTEMSAQMKAIQPITQPIREQLNAARLRGDHREVARLNMETYQVYRRTGVKFNPLLFMPIVVQMTLGFGMFRLLRNAGQLPVPGLETGGLLWFTNLTVADPTFILPASTSILLYYVVRRGGETGAQGMENASPLMKSIMLYVLPVISFLFTAWQPAALQVYFWITSILTHFQGYVFRTNAFRRRLGLTPMYKAPQNSAHQEAPKGSKPSDSHADTQRPVYVRPRPPRANVIDGRLTSEKSQTPNAGAKSGDAPILKDEAPKFSPVKPWTWGTAQKKKQLSPEEAYRQKLKQYEKLNPRGKPKGR